MEVDQELSRAVKNIERSFSAIEDYGRSLENELMDLREHKREHYTDSQAIRSVMLMDAIRNTSISLFRKYAKNEFGITSRKSHSVIMQKLVDYISERADHVNIVIDKSGHPKIQGEPYLNNQFYLDNKKYNRTRLQVSLQFESALLTLTNAFEAFFQVILECSYDTVLKNKIDKQTAEFSEIRNLSSIEEVKSLYMVKVTEEIKRGPVVSWFKCFKGMGFNEDKSDEDQIQKLAEVFDVRNLIVHNGGLVNSKYRKQHPESKHKINSPISISKKYLENTIRTMRYIYVDLVFCTWPKISKCALPNQELDTMFDVDLDLLSPESAESFRIYKKLKNVLLKEDHKQQVTLMSPRKFSAYFNYLLNVQWHASPDSDDIKESKKLIAWLYSVTYDPFYLLGLELLQHNFEQANIQLSKVLEREGKRFLILLAQWPIVLYDSDVLAFLNKKVSIRDYVAKEVD